YPFFLFPCVPPLLLSFCLQPSHRPSLQPTFSLDCVSAPSPHHHCHQNQRFASQLSLCTGKPHPSSPCSHLPTPPFYSSSLKFTSHFSSSPCPEPQSPPLQHTTFYNKSLSQHQLNPDSKSYPSQTNMYYPSYTDSGSLSNGSCPHNTNPPTNGHVLCSSHPKSNSSHFHPWPFSLLLSQSSQSFNSLPCSMSDVYPHTLQIIQPKSSCNLKTLLLPSFHPDCQTNPRSPLNPDFDPQIQHPALQSCGRPPLVPPAPHTERVLPVTPASTNPHPPSQMPSLPVTTHAPFSIACSQRHVSRPLKAGGVLLNCTKAFSNNKDKPTECVCLKKSCNMPVCGAFAGGGFERKCPHTVAENVNSLILFLCFLNVEFFSFYL
ncbi:uncharacterized protein, partial [Embiotoca jacksoni]|uniref:uncharacterized protein n=1 Tax=Embiotoca jacksoni TaxID=100190 RepID=UPI003704CB2D